MALTQAQAGRVEKLALAYDEEGPGLSFADWMVDRGEGDLLAAVEETLTELGDDAAVAALHAEPELVATGAPTPDQMWEKFDAPTTGGPWALNKYGRWRQAQADWPGRAITAQGRSIYVPPQHDSVRIDEASGYGGNTDPEIRWTDQKFRAACAAALQSDPFYKLFFQVAPRGGILGAGRAFQDTPEDYESEGGELYPFLEGSDPKATELNNWWRRQTFDTKYGYPRGMTLNWLRVYTGPNGYRRYKAWTKAEATDFFERWWIADAGYVCPPDAIQNQISETMRRQAERQGAQTEGDYSAHWAWIIGPLDQCSVPSKRRRAENLRKAAAIAAVVVGAVFAGPAIWAVMKGIGAKVAGGLKAAASAAGSAIGSAASSAGDAVESAAEQRVKEELGVEEIERAESEAAEIINDPETQAAIERGELPPPSDPDFAVVLAQWWMARELAKQREQIADPEARRRQEIEDAGALAQTEAQLRREILRIQREAEAVASGRKTEQQAADEIMTTAAGVSPNVGMLAALGIGAAVVLSLSNKRR